MWKPRRSGAPRKIVVEALIAAPVELVWERTQTPEEHVRWDIRFTDIRYRAETDERGYRLLDYRTDVAFGVEVEGVGRYLHSTPLAHSTFEFDSKDWKSIIRNGRGIWLYERRGECTYFKSVYDYDRRFGWPGAVIDRLIFRELLRLATEWGFETLRLWCAGDEEAPERRRDRPGFLLYFLRRRLGASTPRGAAISWLGSGQETRLSGTAGDAPKR